jgi:hypothetical protein
MNGLSFEEGKESIKTTLVDQGESSRPIAEKTESEESLAHLDGLRSFYKLRTKWSKAILWFIIVSLIFQFSITFVVGMDWLNFEKYPWFLPLVVTENFIQIIGLAIIVVKFLFNEPRK